MKIERKNIKQFNPIVITLESKEEAEALMTILGRIVGSGSIRKLSDCIYLELSNAGIESNSDMVLSSMVLK